MPPVEGGIMSCADVAQLVEHVLGKDGVSGSIPLIGSRNYLGDHSGLVQRTS